MDNDIKVIEKDIKQRHQDVLLFLQSELEPLKKQAAGAGYNLETEYANTRKNKSIFVIIMMLACVAVLGASFLVMNHIITKNNREVVVNLEEFDGVNLKDLIDSVQRTQGKYDESVKRLTQLKGELSVELKDAEEKRDSDLMVIESLKLKNKTEEANRIKTVNATYNDTVAAIHKKYDADIIAGQLEVDQYKAQVDEFDAAKFNAAREKEQALDSERRLQELKQQELTDKYEARILKLENTIEVNRKNSTAELKRTVKEITDTYQSRIDLLDPFFTDEKGRNLVDSVSLEVPRLEENQVFTEEKADEIKDKTLLEEYQTALDYYKDYRYIQGRLSSIPYERDVPSYMKISRALVDEMAEVFVDSGLRIYNAKEDMEADYIRQLQNKDKEIQAREAEIRATEARGKKEQEKLETVMEGTMTLLKTSCLVMTATDYKNIEVYVAQKARYLIKPEGTKAELKAGKTTVKGTIVSEGSRFYFRADLKEDGSFTTPFILEEVLPGTTVKVFEK